MGAPIIGRTKCPECSFDGAHVKRSEKCIYRFCPECGAMYHAKTARQAADLEAKMRPLAPLGLGVPTPTPENVPAELEQLAPTPGKVAVQPAKASVPTPTPTTTPPTPPMPPAAAAPRRSGLFGI